MQPLRCPAEVPLVGNRHKAAQVTQLHRASVTLGVRPTLRFAQCRLAQNALDTGWRQFR
jgi:hypothetical protein